MFYNLDRNNSMLLNKLNITIEQSSNIIKNFFNLLKKENLYKSLIYYDNLVEESININFIKNENFKNSNKSK
jgi:hypothetical protein